MRTKRHISHGIVIALLAVGAFAMVIPLIWMVLGSFKTLAEISQIPPTWLPKNPILSNYAEVFQRVPFARYFRNSVIVSLIAVVSVTLTSAAAGYSLAKFHFRGATVVLLIFISSLVVPFQTRMIALYQMTLGAHLNNTLLGVVLPFLMDAFAIFIVRQYILGIPDELIEAARIDGASEPGIFFRIIVPMASPALATVAILTFLNSWQEFLWPLIVTDNDAARTLPVGLQSFATQYATNTNLQMAGAVITTLPLIIVFLIFQRKIIDGMATAGLK